MQAEFEHPADAFVAGATEKWIGDLDGMIKRRRIRVLVANTKTHYFVDRGRERGLAVDSFRAWEEELNRRLRKMNPKAKNLRVEFRFIPVSHDKLFPYLLEGRGDIVAADLTVTPERREIVDFSVPTTTNVRVVIVTGPASPALASLDDLAGKEVYVRRSSTYSGDLERLNERFRAAGKPPITLYPADENLESEDILGLLAAGAVPLAVAHEHIAKFWGGVFDHVTVRSDLAIAEGGSVAPAFRKNSPRLRADPESCGSD